MVSSMMALIASFVMAFYSTAGYPETTSFFTMVASVVLLYHTFIFYEGTYNFQGEDMIVYTKTFIYTWISTALLFCYINHYASDP